MTQSSPPLPHHTIDDDTVGLTKGHDRLGLVFTGQIES